MKKLFVTTQQEDFHATAHEDSQETELLVWVCCPLETCDDQLGFSPKGEDFFYLYCEATHFSMYFIMKIINCY